LTRGFINIAFFIKRIFPRHGKSKAARPGKKGGSLNLAGAQENFGSTKYPSGFMVYVKISPQTQTILPNLLFGLAKLSE
jgi:hypothetical protein